MYDRITLGLSGDAGPIQTRLLNHPECVFPVSVAKDEASGSVTYIYFDPSDDLFVLDRYVGVVAEYIIDRYEPRLIRRIIEEEHSELSAVAKREVLKNVECFGDDPKLGYRARRQAVILSIYDYLKEDSTMLMDGFVAFRLKDYEALLSELSARLVDEYLTQKEYEDFISLLRYFVSVQKIRPPKMHIIVSPQGGYSLLDENENDITAAAFADFIDGEILLTEEAYDDLLISVLITLAPMSITVHNRANIRNEELFLTISRVFDGKIEYCTGCEICLS